jgi:hypothetical protein
MHHIYELTNRVVVRTRQRGELLMATDGSLIKSPSGPEVYLIDGGKRRWIPDTATLLSRWTWADIQYVSDADLNAIPLGLPYPSVLVTSQWPDGALVVGSGDPHVYVIKGGQRHWIPDPETFAADGYDWAKLDNISLAYLNAIPLGTPLPSTRRLIIDTGDYHLGANHWMHTRAGLTLGTGKFTAQTRTWSLTWFGGFHGGVSMILHDADELPLANGVISVQRFGVDGTAVGTSDRTDAWPTPSVNLDPNEAVLVQNMVCFQAWAPDNFQTVLNKWVQAGKSVTELIQDASGVAAAFRGQPAK